MTTSEEKFRATLKQTEISKWFEIHVVRRTGYYLALGLNRLDIHPNTVTIWSMFLGAGSAYFFASGSFYYDGLRGLLYNIIAVALLYWANILDNTDGVLARMSGKKSRIGRILDGLAGFVWATPIYFALVWRIYQNHDWEFGLLGIENNEVNSLIFGILVLILAFYSGIACHAGQQRIADYFMQAHLYFMKSSNGSEFENSKDVTSMVQNLPADTPWWERLFLKSYIVYTKKQERTAPELKQLMEALSAKYGGLNNVPDDFREEMHQRSLKIMRYDMIGFMYRAISLAVFTVVDFPLGHFLFETIVLGCATHWLVSHYRGFCAEMIKRLK